MKLHNETDKIKQQIELKAPVARVWRALTDHLEFSEWFGADLKDPFIPGQVCRGQITIPGYEHLTFEAVAQKMEPASFPLPGIRIQLIQRKITPRNRLRWSSFGWRKVAPEQC